MTFLLFAGFGASLSACLFHLTLGLRRPRQQTHLIFASMMAMLCIYLLVQRAYYVLTSTEHVVGFFHIGPVVTIAWFGTLGAFVCRYTGARVLRWQAWSFYGVLLAWFIVNLLLPHGIFFPVVNGYQTAVMLGEQVGIPIAVDSAISTAWYAFEVTFGIWAFESGILMTQTSRVRGGLFSVAIALYVLALTADFVRDLFGGGWPYISEFGVVTMSLLMSIGLALDFRAKGDALERAFVALDARASHLARLVAAARAVRSHIDPPLQVLEQGVRQLVGRDLQEQRRVAVLARAVARLAELEGRLKRELTVEQASLERALLPQSPTSRRLGQTLRLLRANATPK